jgi:hypothetical protein
MDNTGTQLQREFDAAKEAAERDAMLIMLGRAQASDSISVTLSAQVIRGLEFIEETKKYRTLGYERFTDFLKHCGLSNMTKNRYYDRKKLLDREGDPLFDVLTVSGIPISTRKLLADGDVRLDGDKLIVKIDDEEVILEKSNFTGIASAITTLAASLADNRKKIEKGEADYRKLKEKFLEVEESAGSGSAIPDLDKAHMVACGAIAALVDEIAKLKPADCQAYLDGPFNLLATQYQRINDAICDKLELESLD